MKESWVAGNELFPASNWSVFIHRDPKVSEEQQVPQVSPERKELQVNQALKENVENRSAN